MADYLLDVASLGVRWLHLIAGIAWIGASFYFVWLDNHLDPSPEPGVAGELWSVHGGGFYNKRKFLVAPERVPSRLHWFKWEAYWTWISGFTLLVLVYYIHPDAYLVRPGGPISGPQAVIVSLALVLVSFLVYDVVCRSPIGQHGRSLAIVVLVGACLAEWLLAKVFSGRGAYIQVGAMLGTMMAANVLVVIIPGQRRVVAAMLAGRPPDPADGRRGKQRSMHNNYLTLPVLFVMISNHSPLTYGATHPWAVLGVMTAAGMLIRQFVNERQRGRIVLTPLLSAAALLIGLTVALAPIGSLSLQRNAAVTGTRAPAVPLDVAATIVAQRCAACHSAHPTKAGYSTAPAGVSLDDATQMTAHRADIVRVVSTGAMPLGNATNMTDAERASLLSWARG